MRHLKNIFLIYLACVAVSISQYFITGIYGKAVFLPILLGSVVFYIVSQVKQIDHEHEEEF